MRSLLLSAGVMATLGALALREPGSVPLPPAPQTQLPAAIQPGVPPLPPARSGPWPEQVARPLFEPDRRPPSPPTGPHELAEPDFEPPPPSAAAGIVVGPGGPVALLRLADGRLLRAPEGAEVDGWHVARIAPTTVELRRGERRLSLSARLPVPD